MSSIENIYSYTVKIPSAQQHIITCDHIITIESQDNFFPLGYCYTWHLSIVSDESVCPQAFTRCSDINCTCCGTLYHCYLCAAKKGSKESVLIRHFEKKHWIYRVSHPGRKLFSNTERCWILLLNLPVFYCKPDLLKKDSVIEGMFLLVLRWTKEWSTANLEEGGLF